MTIRLRRRASEEGMALATSMLIMLLCAVVVAGVLQLAGHSAQRSGQNRDRNAALNAAEAGISAELSLISDGGCPTAAGAETPLPNQTVPMASYIIQPPPAATCTTNGPAVIVATGYVPNATHPSSTTTMVAHINRTQGAPVSGGGASGGYDFPDALFADGSLTATAGALNLFGSGGSVPNVTAKDISIGSAAITGDQLGGAISGQGTVLVSGSQIGGPVAGKDVTVSGPTTGGATVQGSVAATGSLSLNSVTVNGTATPTSYSRSGTVTVTVAGGVAPALPLARPLGSFTNNPGAIGSALVGGMAPTTTCPSGPTAWASSFYDLASPCVGVGYAPTTYAPTAGNGSTVLVVQGAFTVNVPPTSVGGQLYVVDVGAGAGADSLTIAGSGSTLPVFAFTDGTLNLSGALVGQAAAHTINVTGSSATMTFTPPTTPMPDISFPVGYTAPDFTRLPYLSTVAFEYQCSGTTAC